MFDRIADDLLGFTENLVLTANPTKLGPDWWHGTLNGKSGYFPSAYVAELGHGKLVHYQIRDSNSLCL